jgi:uncharacterized protein YegL
MKIKIMQKQKTIYHLIVDKSGSMSDCIENTINGVNEQVKKITDLQKEFSEQELTIGLTTFNHEVYHHFFQSPPVAVRKISTETYQTSGTTALLDAIGMTATTIEKEMKMHEHKIPTTVVIVILTDGYENSSRLFKLEDIRNLISRLEETGNWTFSFLGATLDAVEVAESLSIKKQNSSVFMKENMNNEVWSKLSDSMEGYFDKKRKGRSLNNLFGKD